MALEYYEDHPFVFDRETWELFSMGGSSRDKWRKVQNSDSCVRIEFQASEISEFEAKSLAEALPRERAEDLAVSL